MSTLQSQIDLETETSYKNKDFPLVPSVGVILTKDDLAKKN
jgi:hypothetical protein